MNKKYVFGRDSINSVCDAGGKHYVVKLTSRILVINRQKKTDPIGH